GGRRFGRHAESHHRLSSHARKSSQMLIVRKRCRQFVTYADARDAADGRTPYSVVQTLGTGSGILPVNSPSPTLALNLTNRLLDGFSARGRVALLAPAENTSLRPGQTFAAPGEAVTAGFFPKSGVLAYVSEMTTGHHVTVNAIGAEGLVGGECLFGATRHHNRIVALLDSHGCRVSADVLRRAFEDQPEFRHALLAHLGAQLREVTSLLACARVHSQRRRLARWLLMMMDKARQPSLHVTHDVLAQMVGGPRH